MKCIIIGLILNHHKFDKTGANLWLSAPVFVSPFLSGLAASAVEPSTLSEITELRRGSRNRTQRPRTEVTWPTHVMSHGQHSLPSNTSNEESTTPGKTPDVTTADANIPKIGDKHSRRAYKPRSTIIKHSLQIPGNVAENEDTVV